MCYGRQFQQSQSDKLILKQNGIDPRYSGAKKWRHTFDIDSKTKILGVYGATLKYSKLKLVCKGLFPKCRSLLDFTNCFKTSNQNECCYFIIYCKKHIKTNTQKMSNI